MTEQRRLHLEGLHCEGCATSVQQYLRSEPGVETATVSKDRAEAVVTVTEEADRTALVEGLRLLGYDADWTE